MSNLGNDPVDKVLAAQTRGPESRDQQETEGRSLSASESSESLDSSL